MNILKNATRFIIGGFAACAAMIACTAGSASAQSLPATSWLPAHKAAETVYISPATDPALAAPFESFAFKSELKGKNGDQYLNLVNGAYDRYKKAKAGGDKS